MPRGMRRMDYRMMRDMRRGRGRQNDYASDYGYNYSQYDSRRGDRTYSEQDYARGRRNYEHSGQYNMASDYAMRGRGRDGHYPSREGGSTYYPIEAMGVFNGYYGMPEDYARGRRDYGYDYNRGYDYGYDYAGDYGEKLTKEELEHWNKKLMKELDEPSRNYFKKEMVAQKAKQMGVSMDKFNEEELLTASLMMYTDYAKAIKPYVGSNMDVYVKMGELFLTDPDASVKGGEKLAVYYDCIVDGEDD